MCFLAAETNQAGPVSAIFVFVLHHKHTLCYLIVPSVHEHHVQVVAIASHHPRFASAGDAAARE